MYTTAWPIKWTSLSTSSNFNADARANGCQRKYRSSVISAITQNTKLHTPSLSLSSAPQ